MNDIEKVKKGAPVVLITVSGLGVAPPGPTNAVSQADTSNLDALWPVYPHGTLHASGIYIGLPDNRMGNSELGHLTIGAGKVIMQPKQRIDHAIKTDSFKQNQVFIDAVDHSNKNNSAVHLIGLISSSDKCSSIEHLYALLELIKEQGFDPDKVFLHVITDGIDDDPKNAINLISDVEDFCITNRVGRVASIIGRRFAMDSEKKWERTQVAYELLTLKKGKVVFDWKRALSELYKAGITDDILNPLLIINRSDKLPMSIKDNDAIIFFNYDRDTSLALTRSFEDKTFKYWNRHMLENIFFVGFTQYSDRLPKKIAFKSEPIEVTLSSVLSENNKKQLKISLTDNFANATYFFNGGKGEVYENEVWLEVPSPTDVLTYDQKPEMNQTWLTDKVIEKLEEETYDFILANFSGPLLIAKTSNIAATIETISVVDQSIGRIAKEVLKRSGMLVITSECTLAEEMINVLTGERQLEGTTNEVPILIVKEGLDNRELPVGTLEDVAPTILKLMDLEIPPEMTGKCLL